MHRANRDTLRDRVPHDALEVDDKENCPRCLGIFGAEILHMEAVDNYLKLNQEIK